MKSEHQLRVEQFMNKAAQMAPGKQGVPDRPMVPSKEVRLLRAKLILEEALETVEALGFCVEDPDGGVVDKDYDVVPLWKWMGSKFLPVTDADINLDEIADGCADLSVVSIGTLSACGILDKPILECVDQNNLEKFGPGCTVSESGKLIKPPNHKPPNLKWVIANLRFWPFVQDHNDGCPND